MPTEDEPKLPPELELELVKSTEAAAVAASHWIGRGDKNRADGEAVAAMRRVLGTAPMSGVVIIGEGEKDQAPMLHNGEVVGNGTGARCDIAVDPIDGTTLTAEGIDNAISVIAVAEAGSMFSLPGYEAAKLAQLTFYMDKLAVGPEAAGKVDISASVAENLHVVATAKGCGVNDLTVCVLDRPRHDDIIAQIRAAGAMVSRIKDGDVGGAIETAWPESGIDMLIGIGGAPEAVIAACGLKCLGGEILARYHPTTAQEHAIVREFGLMHKVFRTNDLVSSDNVFFAATGITDGKLVRGVRHAGETITSYSLAMSSQSSTIREIKTTHLPDRY